MATYKELFTNTTNEYSARLFVDAKRNTATAYVKINQHFEIRFGFVDPYKQDSTLDCLNTNCMDRNTNKPVVGITAGLFCPSDDVTTWQLDLMYRTGERDTIHLTPTGNKYKNCVATTEVVDIQTLLDSADSKSSIFEPLRRSDNPLRDFLKNLED